MTVYAKQQSTAVTHTLNSNLINLMTLPGLSAVNTRIVAMAGYISISVPVIAYYLTKSSVVGFLSLAQYVGGATQSAAAQVVSEVTSGNVSLGNLQLDNHSAHNTNATHWDNNMRYFSGANSYQMPGGSTITRTAGSDQVIDNRAAISSLGTSINLAESIRAAYQQQADKSWTTMQSEAKTYGESIGAAIRQVDDMGATNSISSSSTSSVSHSSSASESTSFSNVHQLIDRFAQSENVSHSTARQYLVG